LKYIGNKFKLLGFIESSLRLGGAPSSGHFTDLFSGTTSVAEHFKKLGFSVTANDFMTYSYALQKAFIEANEIPDFRKLLSGRSIDELETPALSVISHLNDLEPVKGYAFQNYGYGGSESRMYFTGDNASRVDAIREQLAEWYQNDLISDGEFYYLLAALIDAADHVANMSGTYGAYLKVWRSVALKRIELKTRPVHDNALRNSANQKFAETLIKEISGEILYLDPPYNTRQYASNFHVLESIAVWDKQPLRGKTGLRQYDDQKSDFSTKSKAAAALESIVTQAKFDFIALSYNNEGIIPHEEILKILHNRGEVKVFSHEYRRFRTERDHEKRQYKNVGDKTEEFLFVLRVTD
jgi:adenine-specific DNA-methyltransferase